MSKIGRILASSIAASVVAGTAMAGLLVAPAQATETATPDSDISEMATPNSDIGTFSDSGCTNKVKVGNARHKGDIFHSYAFTVWKHNHVGIYYTTKTIVEAPGTNSKSQARTAATLNKCGPIHKMYVKATQTSRNKAANYAYNNLRGKEYDTDFARNKINGADKLNCSELVWRAYKSVNIELDSNGGAGVFPNNIKNDDSTVIYSTHR